METEFNQNLSLINAVIDNNYFIGENLLNNGVDTEVTLYGKTALIIAVEKNNMYNIAQLLEYGAKTEVTFEKKHH
jgi:ankyrin repeat protein